MIVSRKGRPALDIRNLVAAFDEGQFLRQPPGHLVASRTFELARLGRLASDECLHRAYGWRRRGPTDDLLDVLAQVPDVLAGILLPEDSGDPTGTPAVAVAIASASAVGVHVRLNQAFAAPGRAAAANAVGDKLDRAEADYRRRLHRCRAAARRGDGEALRALAAAASEEAHGHLATVVGQAGRASRSRSPRAAELGLRASALARRYALLVAGCIAVDGRVRAPRSAAAVRRAAEGVERLARPPMRVPRARRRVGERDAGARVELVARATRVTWVERPRKPYTRMRTERAGVPVVVGHKSMGRRGVTAGAHVWALGHVKRIQPEGLVVECEFEGPDRHRRHYFEDWLATVARPAYDLYPGSVAMEWELPGELDRRAGWDLFSRLGRRGGS